MFYKGGSRQAVFWSAQERKQAEQERRKELWMAAAAAAEVQKEQNLEALRLCVYTLQHNYL